MSALHRPATVKERVSRAERAKDYGVEAKYGGCLETATSGNAESDIARGLMHMHLHRVSSKLDL